MFSREFCKISKNAFFAERLRATASVHYHRGRVNILVHWVPRLRRNIFSLFQILHLPYVPMHHLHVPFFSRKICF